MVGSNIHIIPWFGFISQHHTYGHLSNTSDWGRITTDICLARANDALHKLEKLITAKSLSNLGVEPRTQAVKGGGKSLTLTDLPQPPALSSFV